MKQSVISTCRSWYHLAFPFLIEAVIINDDVSCALLLDTLAKSKSNPGRYIKYLYCGKLDYLSSISRWCPNLVVLNMSTPRHSLRPRLPLPQLLSTLTSFTYCEYFAQSDEMFRLLSSVSNIHRLELCVRVAPRRHSLGSRTLVFPHLRSLTLRNQNSRCGESCELIAEKWHMPNLRSIYGIGELSQWPQCFDAPSVTALTYTTSFYSPSVLSACPKLEEVTFRSRDIVWMPGPVPSRRVNLFCFTIETLHDHFVSLNNPVTYPRLQVISIFNRYAPDTSVVPRTPEQWNNKRDWTFWSYWYRRWGSRNVRLEDGLGAIIIPPEHTIFGTTTDDDYNNWYYAATMGNNFFESIYDPPYEEW